MPRFTPEALLRQLQALPAPSGYCVAFSGGLDSHVLLHALHRVHAALGVPVRALHVDHRLHPDSLAWARHCAAVCAGLELSCTVLTVDAHPVRGQSPEAAAREARYAALRDALGPDEALLTGHHQDDQAETVLLQLLRGAGPHGLAAMPQAQRFGSGRRLRPLLGFARAALLAYAREQGLAWLDDPSNQSLDFDRNILRLDILPRLTRHWPGAAQTLARAARHQAQAAGLLDAIAADDLSAARPEGDALPLDAVRRLSPGRQRNLIRAWIRGRGLPLPDSRRLDTICAQVLDARADAGPRVGWAGVELRRYRDRLYVLEAPPAPPAGIHGWADLDRPLAIPGVGMLHGVRTASGGGLDPARLADRALSVRFRRGGERCRPAGRGQTHTLKHLFQEWGVPPWRRAFVPLLYADESIAAVVGHCVCDPFQAPGGAPSVQIRLELRGRD